MKKFFAILLAAALIFSFASVAHAASPITKDQYYARSTLSGDELEFYEYSYNVLASGNKRVYPSKYGLSNERGRIIGNYAIDDSPELFNYRGYYSDSEVAKFNGQLREETDKILSLLSDNMSEYEKVKTIYLFLGNAIEYNYDITDDLNAGVDSKEVETSETIVGGILNKKAVCGGISRALQYLLYKAGILSYVIDGTLDNAIVSGHAWNMIQIDGEWYYADLTSDLKLIKSGSLKIFLFDNSILKDHHLDNSNPPLPAFISTKYMQPEATPAPDPTSTPVATPDPRPTVISANVESTPMPGQIDAETANYMFIYFIPIIAAAVIITVVLTRWKRETNKK